MTSHAIDTVAKVPEEVTELIEDGLRTGRLEI
jgi:hypothetical protein